MNARKSRRNAAVWFFALIFSLASLVWLTGCTKYEIPDPGTAPYSSSKPDVVFENADTVTYGSIHHGLADPELGADGKLALPYDGGELAVDYEVSAEGKGKSIGFLLFLNGKPQPYRIEEGGAYAYLHPLELETDNEPVRFCFTFPPIQGKRGDLLTLSILSVYNPTFRPNMADTSSYGGYHEILPYTCRVQFNADAPPAAPPAARQGVLSGTSETRKLTRAFLTGELPANGYNGEVSAEQIERQLYQSILYDGKITYDHLAVRDGEKLPVTYTLCGPAGTEYETTFFLDHQPLAVDGSLSFHTSLTKGDMQVIGAELDTSALADFQTFYAVTIPVGTADDMWTVKTSSILLYKEK